jgi:hypothetical protein
MCFKIETIRSRNRMTLKISGRLRRKNLADLQNRVKTDPTRTVLDEVANPSPYIREWMNRERNLESQ